jgi:DNA-binding SARP family transcriptional activator
VLQIVLLGPLEVTRDGEPLTVPGGRTAELLVRLALDAGVFVRAGRLVDDLWAETAVTTRRATLLARRALRP